MAAIGLIGFSALFVGGCLAIHAEEDCHCVRDREKFARQIAQQVVELQNKQDQDQPEHH
ncbi:MAG: hypothetical protein JW810_03620 [Sedimentisphaerales bacterium]|nr:hypothetical protein [Sedimentisphaerales bacterium]